MSVLRAGAVTLYQAMLAPQKTPAAILEIDGKESLRLDRLPWLFRPSSGRSVVLPVDHGPVFSAIPELADPPGIFREMIQV